MASTKQEVISTLNGLIETCRDGENGFREAAQAIRDPQLKALFQQFSQQRMQFASELRAEVTRLGGNPENTGSVAGSVHRGWINLKAAVTGRNEEAIVSECERGEDVAKDAYAKALKQALPADLSAIVQRQYSQVLEAHDRVRALEKAYQSR